MRVLVVGAGGVGAALVDLLSKRGFVTHGCIADYDPHRAKRTAERAGERWEPAQVDAADIDEVVELVRASKADVLVNACDPRFVPALFAAAGRAGVTYIDMAMSLSEPHPIQPYRLPGVKLGDRQFAEHEEWGDKGRLALIGMGVEPGMSNVFARYAADELFSKVEEFGVRDGSDLVISGAGFAPTFNVWTVIEECLNPPLVYERDKGWFCTEPFSELEVFDFPEGIGRLECVNVEHEEVAMIPRYLDANRVTFKYGLGSEFVEVLRVLHKLGMDSKTPMTLRGLSIAPRDVVAAVLPDPSQLGERMSGRTCAGTWVRGLDKQGRDREVYLYHVVDNEWSVGKHGSQAVVWQTALGPAVALELIAEGAWKGVGVLGPEVFDPRPFLQLLETHGAPAALRDQVTHKVFKP